MLKKSLSSQCKICPGWLNIIR